MASFADPVRCLKARTKINKKAGRHENWETG